MAVKPKVHTISGMPVVNRTYEHVEERWLREYLAIVRPLAKIEFEKKLTLPAITKTQASAQKVSPRFQARVIAKLDAFLAATDHVEIWEAKQYPQFGAVSQLLQYAHSWPSSSEAREYPGLPLQLYLLASHPNRHVEESAMHNGIVWQVFAPQWLVDHQIAVQEKGKERRLAFEAQKATGGNPSGG